MMERKDGDAAAASVGGVGGSAWWETSTRIPSGSGVNILQARTIEFRKPSDENAADIKVELDVEGIRAMFPYGRMLPVEVRGGGLSFQSGRVVEALGDGADRAVIAVAAVTVGF